LPIGLDIAGRGSAPRSPWIPEPLVGAGVLRWTAANLVATVLYFALGCVVSQFFAAYGLFPAPIWLPTGIAVVAAMVGQLRMLPGIFLGSFLTNALLFAPPLHVTTIISCGNALGPVIGALVMARLRPARGLFTSFYGVVAFVFCSTFLSPAISAGFGTVALAIGEPFDATRLYSIWVTWWLCDSGGTLYLAPAVILWLGLERESAMPAPEAMARLDRHNLAIWGWIAVVSVALFLTPSLRGVYVRAAFPFLLVVPLSWIALRMSLRSAYSLVTLVAIVSTAGTVAGFGPFQNPSLANPLQLVGTLVVLLAMNVLTIVALVNERHEAETANRVKSMFLADTSHELRAPLNAIIGFSSMIENPAVGPIPQQQYGDYARLIQSSGEHLLALINDLLEMSKIEAGRVDLREEPVGLLQTIAEAVDLMSIQARAKSITLEALELEPDGETIVGELTVKADARALRQILLNLLSNAIKFTPDGGRIAVSVARGVAGEAILRVSDTGIGIPADALERVFRPFERAHRHGAHAVEGTGLGLSITQGLVMLHGGTIKLESMVGLGTVATVSLPASRVIAPAPAARAKAG
jgi:two-component system, cell cycle sensor histidine kinase PleC